MHYNVGMGVYVMLRQALNDIPHGSAYGFDHRMHDLVAASEHVAARKSDGYWLDIGRPDDYAQDIDHFENSSATFLMKQSL